jgi:hypothetical protein
MLSNRYTTKESIMKNPLTLYRKSQEVQLNWIRQHPVQWLALNGVLIAAFSGYMWYKDRQEFGPIEEENTKPAE